MHDARDMSSFGILSILISSGEEIVDLILATHFLIK